MTMAPRIGIDLGGTKIAITVLDPSGLDIFTHRVATPRGDYAATLGALAGLVRDAERQLGCEGRATIGIGMPGSLSPANGRVQNANSVWLNGQFLDADLNAMLTRPVRLANDANCFALSEAADGAGRGAASIFGVILGTGCGGGLVRHGRLIDGPLGIGGEWGHNPLPWPLADEIPGRECWCGLRGCVETWVSGPALYRDYLSQGGDAGRAGAADAVAQLSENGDAIATAALDRHASRLARGLATVVNLFDPHAIILGGGLSKLTHLYTVLPRLITPYVFAENVEISVRPPLHGDASGARGAARLWDEA